MLRVSEWLFSFLGEIPFPPSSHRCLLVSASVNKRRLFEDRWSATLIKIRQSERLGDRHWVGSGSLVASPLPSMWSPKKSRQPMGPHVGPRCGASPPIPACSHCLLRGCPAPVFSLAVLFWMTALLLSHWGLSTGLATATLPLVHWVCIQNLGLFKKKNTQPKDLYFQAQAMCWKGGIPLGPQTSIH